MKEKKGYEQARLESLLRDEDTQNQRVLLFAMTIGISATSAVIMFLAIMFTLPNLVVVFAPYVTRFEVARTIAGTVLAGVIWVAMFHVFTLVMYVRFYNAIKGGVRSTE